MKNNCVAINGTACLKPSDWNGCDRWTLQTDKLFCIMDNQNQEAVNIAGAQVNIHKLLGIHEQTKLVDACGHGVAISGGDVPGYPAENAFNLYKMEWKSQQAVPSDIINYAYIGYDFGAIKLPNGRQRYGIDASVRLSISSFTIKQGSGVRATKVRVERSEDGSKWYGVSVISLPDTDDSVTLFLKKSVPSRYWRLRPVEISSSVGACAPWGVQALQMSEYSATEITNIQDSILMENRDRDYDVNPQMVKGFYELMDIGSDLTRFGIDVSMTEYRIKINFTDLITKIGRPLIIGDMLELPSEAQYDASLNRVLRYLEVTDVSWDASTYTPGWQPLMLLVTAKPALASQETRSIFGDMSRTVDTSDLFTGDMKLFKDYQPITDTIRAEALNDVPERGNDAGNQIREFSSEEVALAESAGVNNIQSIGLTPKSLYVEDAIPPNGLPYTEGKEYPANPSDGDYHRLTHVGLSKDVPAALYRWSSKKNRWLYLETDRRDQFNNQTALLTDFLTSTKRASSGGIK